MMVPHLSCVLPEQGGLALIVVMGKLSVHELEYSLSCVDVFHGAH